MVWRCVGQRRAPEAYALLNDPTVRKAVLGAAAKRFGCLQKASRASAVRRTFRRAIDVATVARMVADLLVMILCHTYTEMDPPRTCRGRSNERPGSQLIRVSRADLNRPHDHRDEVACAFSRGTSVGAKLPLS
jgi:hypothetical protein